MASASVCQVCSNALIAQFPPDSDDGDDDHGAQSSTLQVPDDVTLLACQHHFHWQCLLDTFNSTCPSCQSEVISSGSGAKPQILVTIENEGGRAEAQDIRRVLLEEQYLRQHPHERKARAFLEFCREGDADAVVDLLQQGDDDEDDDMMDDDDDDEPDVSQMSLGEILRYQDRMSDGMTGLQAAILGGNATIVWLLLWVASGVNERHFPAAGVAYARELGIQRALTDTDIRTLRDDAGRGAEDIAKQTGDAQWMEWLGNQRLQA